MIDTVLPFNFTDFKPCCGGEVFVPGARERAYSLTTTAQASEPDGGTLERTDGEALADGPFSSARRTARRIAVREEAGRARGDKGRTDGARPRVSEGGKATVVAAPTDKSRQLYHYGP